MLLGLSHSQPQKVFLIKAVPNIYLLSIWPNTNSKTYYSANTDRIRIIQTMLFLPENTTEITIAKFRFHHTAVYYVYYCQTCTGTTVVTMIAKAVPLPPPCD